MADTNIVVLIGRLTRDVELKYTANGMAISSGSLAIDRSVKKDGAWIKEAHYFDFSVFGKQAENLKPYMTKGKQIAITGFLKQDRWVDQQTQQNRSKITIVANDVQLLGGRDNNNQQDAGASQSFDQSGYGDTGYGYGN